MLEIKRDDFLLGDKYFFVPLNDVCDRYIYNL